MCNLCNTGIYGRNGYPYGVNTTGNTVNTIQTCGYWNGGYQRMCRDACGNIIARNTGGCQRQTYCCPCCRPCHCGCGCGGGNNGGTGNGGTVGNNGNGTTGNNGVFQCVTFCGYGNGGTQTTGVQPVNNAAAYYARQYGLTCDDNAECVYNF